MKKNLVNNLDCYISRNTETTSVIWAVSPGVLVVDGAPFLVRLSLLLTSLFPLRAYLHSSCQVYRVDQKGQSLRQVSQDVIWRMIVIDFKLLGTLNQVKEAKWHYFFLPSDIEELFLHGITLTLNEVKVAWWQLPF